MKKNFTLLDRYIRIVKKHRKKWLHSELKLMKLCFEGMERIGLPKDKEHENALREFITMYDNSIALIEKDFMNKYRKYIQ